MLLNIQEYKMEKKRNFLFKKKLSAWKNLVEFSSVEENIELVDL